MREWRKSDCSKENHWVDGEELTWCYDVEEWLFSFSFQANLNQRFCRLAHEGWKEKIRRLYVEQS